MADKEIRMQMEDIRMTMVQMQRALESMAEVFADVDFALTELENLLEIDVE